MTKYVKSVTTSPGLPYKHFNYKHIKLSFSINCRSTTIHLVNAVECKCAIFILKRLIHIVLENIYK